MASALCDAFKTRSPPSCKDLSNIMPVELDNLSVILEENKRGFFSNHFYLFVFIVVFFGLISIYSLHLLFRRYIREQLNNDMSVENIMDQYGEYISVREGALSPRK